MIFFKKNTKGAALIEYQIAAIVGVTAIIAASYLGPIITNTFKRSAVVIDSGVNLESRIVMEKVEVVDPLEEIYKSPPISMKYACFNEGMVAAGEAQIRSMNYFGPGFCLHGNQGVWLRNNNTFAFGSVVSTADENNLDTPGSDNNEGLNEAFQIAKLDIDVASTLLDSFAHLIDPSLNGRPKYLDPTASVVQLKSTTLQQNSIQQGRVHSVVCSKKNETLTFKNMYALQNAAIITNCAIKIDSNFTMKNSILATTNTDKFSIHSASSLQIGQNDACTEGGGAQILTMGGVKISSGLELYGGHIVAVENIEIAAQINGQGALILSGKDLSGTSNITMLSCNSKGMEDNIVMTWWEFLLEYMGS
jgi:Flp pilus assembly pilin Flp